MSYDELDSYVDMAREHIAAVRELTAHEHARIRGLAHVQTVRVCQRCDQPINYGSLCPGCDPDRWGLYEENRDRWSI